MKGISLQPEGSRKPYSPSRHSLCKQIHCSVASTQGHQRDLGNSLGLHQDTKSTGYRNQVMSLNPSESDTLHGLLRILVPSKPGFPNLWRESITSPYKPGLKIRGTGLNNNASWAMIDTPQKVITSMATVESFSSQAFTDSHLTPEYNLGNSLNSLNPTFVCGYFLKLICSKIQELHCMEMAQ